MNDSLGSFPLVSECLDPILVYEICHHLVLFPPLARGGRGLEGKLPSPWRLYAAS